MPIYAYRCEECGFAKDALQKVSDAPLTDCPACGKPTFKKQLTAAGFQLKGTGWYVTDFRGNNGAAPTTVPPVAGSAPAATGGESAAPSAPAAPASTPAASDSKPSST
jgi:putative FmdB family regulatory protein